MSGDLTQLALIAIIVVDALIVLALIVVRLMSLRSGRAAGRGQVTTVRPDGRAGSMPAAEPTSLFERADSPRARPAPTGSAAGASLGPTADPGGVSAPEPGAMSVGGVHEVIGAGGLLVAADHATLTSPEPFLPGGDDADWRMALRREAGRVARYGRSLTVMQFEVDYAPDQDVAPAQLTEADAMLLGLVTAQVRISDHLAHPAQGRVWLLLPETDEAAALWVADRIRSRYVQRHPNPPGLLVGWAGSEPGGGVEATLRRAAERVHEDRRRARARVEQAAALRSPALPTPTASVDHSLTTLERLREAGFLTDEEYRAKRADILGRV